MATYPLPTLGPTVTSAGITAPTYSEILESLQATFQSIYGSDAYIAPDSQDGQMLAAIAMMFNDSNLSIVDVFNSFSPDYAQGAQLSSLVKINGITRQVATSSTASVTVVGVAGTVLNNGQVGDSQNLNTRWSLPASVTIAPGGETTVTATCITEGAVTAEAGTLTTILTPTFGWQSATNAAAASPGAPVETDAALRRRQARSTSLPAISPLASIRASVADVDGVTRSEVYENDTDSTDAEGVPSHSISAVVQGGDVDDIAYAIMVKKAPGVGTYGTTSVVVTDPAGVPQQIDFFALDLVALEIEVSITALPGYVSTTGQRIKEAIVEYASSLGIGTDSYTFRLANPANLSGNDAINATGLTQDQLNALSSTYYVTGIEQAESGDPLSTADVVIAFNEAASVAIADITVIVT